MGSLQSDRAWHAFCKRTRIAKWLLALFLWIAVASCATVNPSLEHDRVHQIISQRSGAGEQYDPQLDELIEEKVHGLLAEGLSPDEAVSIALLNNKAFQAAFHEIGLSRADVVQSGLFSNPSLGLAVQFPEGGGRSKLTAGFAQQIADVWQIPVRKQVAQAQLEQVILSAADQALRLRADVKTAYYQTMAAVALEELAVENRRLVEQTVGLARARFEAGEVGLVEVNLVRVQLNNVQLEAISARRAREEAMNRLSRLLGLSRTVQVLTLNGSWPATLSLAAEEEQILLFALGQRLDSAVAALKVKAAQASLERECRNVFSNVMVGIEVERPESRAMPGRDILADTARESIGAGELTAPGIQSQSQRRQERSHIIDMMIGPSLNITLPIWDQNQAQIAKAEYRIHQLRASYEDMLDGVASEVTDALIALRTANELAKFYETQAIPLARQTIEVGRATYRAGEQSVLVLIEAEGALIAQQRAQVGVLRMAAQAQVELERAVGGRLPEEWFTTNRTEPPPEEGEGG